MPFFDWLQCHDDEVATYLHAVGGEQPEEFTGMLDVGVGRIVLSEMPVDDGVGSAPGAMKSLVEFALSGGEDRSSSGLRRLLEKAGFRDVTHRHWDGPYWITEAVAG